MKPKIFKYALYGTLSFFLIATILLFVKNSQLKSDIADLDDELTKTDRMVKGLKKKYSEERAKSAAFQRAKLAVDAEKTELETALVELKKKNEASGDAKDKLIGKLKNEMNGIQKKVTLLSKQNEDLKNEYVFIAGKFKEALKDINLKNAELSKNKEDIQSLTSQLNMTMRNLERAVAHNKKLAELAEDLLVQFDEKGFFASMLEKEPFTQTKRVELERMIQEYLDRIDKEKLVVTDEY